MLSTYHPARDPAEQIIRLVQTLLTPGLSATAAPDRIQPALLRFIETFSESPHASTLTDAIRSIRQTAAAHRTRAAASSSDAGPILRHYWRELADALDTTAQLLQHYRTSRFDVTNN